MFEMLIKLLVSILIASKFIFVLGSVASMGKHGPYKARLYRLGKCNVTAKPWDKNPSLVFNVELYSSSTGDPLLRGNITVFREQSYKKLQVTNYIWENNAWKLVRQMKNAGCSRVFFPVMAATMNVKYNPKTCAIYKGTYPFNNFDNNKALHLWKTTSNYERQLWIYEVSTNTATIICYEFESSIEPIAEST